MAKQLPETAFVAKYLWHRSFKVDGESRLERHLTRHQVLATAAALAVTLLGCSETTSQEAPVFGGYLGDDKHLVHLSVGACHPDRTDTEVHETSDEVRVLVTVTEPDENVDCGTEVTLNLDEPLGDREVVDASTDKTVEISRQAG